jgi:hypothetical protein
VTVLSLFEAVLVVVGRVVVVDGLVVVVVREALVEDVVGREVEGLDDTVFERDTREPLFSAVVEPAMLERRSRVEVVDFPGARGAEVPAMDMRLTVLEIPRRSSPELATDRAFSSAELLIEARERCEAVVEVLSGLRAVEVVVGRVGGLLKVLPFVEERAVDVVLEAPEIELGRFVVVEATGRFVVVLVADEVADFFSGEEATFSLSLEASGLVTGSSLPDRRVESTGVAGGWLSASLSTGAGAGTGSSVEAIARGRTVGVSYDWKGRRDGVGRRSQRTVPGEWMRTTLVSVGLQQKEVEGRPTGETDTRQWTMEGEVSLGWKGGENRKWGRFGEVVERRESGTGEMEKGSPFRGIPRPTGLERR